jgi:proteasome lid subunit RPN8/RPN11
MFLTRKGRIEIPRHVYDEIVAHAKETYPHECCGVLVGNTLGAKKVFHIERTTNLNKERAADRYILDPNELNIIDRLARASSLEILGFYHSHPDHTDRPSKYDREHGQPEYSYLIVSVMEGTDIAIRCWIFSKEDDPFMEEKIVITNPRPSVS